MPLDNKDYQSYLEDTVFKTNELGQFTILFDLFRYLNNSEQNLAILERSYIFGGLSIFAGLAPDASPQIIDFRPRSSKERTGFQQGWLDIEKFNFPRSTGEIVEHADEIIIQKDWMSSEALVLPNVRHHSFDLRRLIRTILLHSQTVKRVYFFDSYLRLIEF